MEKRNQLFYIGRPLVQSLLDSMKKEPWWTLTLLITIQKLFGETDADPEPVKRKSQ